MTPPPRTRRVWAGLATFAACIGAVVLLGSVHSSSGDDLPSSTPTSHAPTSFYSSAAGDWTASPTARNLLGTGCQCNVQIVGGFNGSKGDTGKFETGGELLRAQLLNPNITGVVDGGATHVGATLRSAVVETGLGFKVGGPASTKQVTVAPPDAMTIAGYTVKLPSVAPVANEFLQSTDGTNTKWSNALNGATLSGTTTFAAGSTITGAKFDGTTTIAAGATLTDTQLTGATTFTGGATLAFPSLKTGTTTVTLSPGTMGAGTSATWSFPVTAATDAFVGMGATQTLTGKTFAAPKMTGLVSLDRASMLTIDPKAVECTGDQAGNVLTVVSATGCDIAIGNIGNVIVWANGDRATIVDTGPASQTATLVGGSTRASSAFTLHTTMRTGLLPTTQISNEVAVFKDRITFKTFINGGGTQAVTIDASNTAYTSPHHAKWSFPHPGTTGPWNHRFVGETTTQTLTSKTLAAPTITDATIKSATYTGRWRTSGAVLATSPTPICTTTATSTGGVVTITDSATCVITQQMVGGIIHWDGEGRVSSMITMRISATTAYIVELETPGNFGRSTPTTMRLYAGSQSFSASYLHTTMQSPLLYEDDKSVRLLLAYMGAGTSATWHFPVTAATDTLVGTGATQTLANKKFARLAGDNTVAPATQTVQTAAAGTGATASLAPFSNAVAGTVTVAAGTSPTAGTIVVLSFAGGGGAARAVTLIAANAAAAAVPVYVLSATEAGYSLASASALAAGSTYSWHYHVIG